MLDKSCWRPGTCNYNWKLANILRTCNFGGNLQPWWEHPSMVRTWKYDKRKQLWCSWFMLRQTNGKWCFHPDVWWGKRTLGFLVYKLLWEVGGASGVMRLVGQTVELWAEVLFRWFQSRRWLNQPGLLVQPISTLVPASLLPRTAGRWPSLSHSRKCQQQVSVDPRAGQPHSVNAYNT